MRCKSFERSIGKFQSAISNISKILSLLLQCHIASFQLRITKNLKMNNFGFGDNDFTKLHSQLDSTCPNWIRLVHIAFLISFSQLCIPKSMFGSIRRIFSLVFLLDLKSITQHLKHQSFAVNTNVQSICPDKIFFVQDKNFGHGL